MVIVMKIKSRMFPIGSIFKIISLGKVVLNGIVIIEEANVIPARIDIKMDFLDLGLKSLIFPIR